MKKDSNPMETPIDEALYSRQLYVLGHEAMYRMQSSSVLVIGMKGLGTEIAKNVMLAGVQSLALMDNGLVTVQDLSCGFYYTEEDIGRPRALSCAQKLADLNRYVKVTVEQEEWTEHVLSKYSVVVTTDSTFSEITAVNEMCRKSSTHFIAANSLGAFCSIFIDFGDTFVVNDVDGEQPLRGMICSISNEKEGVVTVYDESRHGLEDGAFVVFEEIQGMNELNGCDPMQIKYLGPYTFSIGDTSRLSAYTGGGYFQQVKMPKKVHFKSFEDVYRAPEIVLTDFAKVDAGFQLHILSWALSEFKLRYKQLPLSDSLEDTQNLAQIAREIASLHFSTVAVDESLVKLLGRCAAAEIAPMTSFIGGVAAQEVLKSCSGKFSPIQQFMYFDARECIPQDVPLSQFSPLGTRYDSQIAVVGKTLHEQLCSQNVFLVGSGAIGCEMLKNWALMGVSTGQFGKIVVTDMDTIEKSNLNRQFLFRDVNVGHLKAEVAKSSILRINSSMSIESHSNRVGTETENVYNDKFWDSLDMVCTALDNVSARLYVDARCVYFGKPLLESGTLGTKGNTQVVVPKMTQNYGATRDPVEQGIPVCTLKNFPNKIDHTIQWARDAFEGLFSTAPLEVNSYLSNPDYMSQLDLQSGSQLENLKILKVFLMERRPLKFEDCIAWARFIFDEKFNHSIQQLLFSFPIDSLTSSGVPFWSGPKRAPSPLEFDAEDPLHLQFISSTANLLAFIFNIQSSTDEEYIRHIAGTIRVPAFEPNRHLKIATNDEELKEEPMDFDEEVHLIAQSLASAQSFGVLSLNPIEFEKDDDSNFHMDFIVSCSNLRARNYRIKEENRLETKRIAGKIIPAIATTTALVSGLICLEMYKLLRRDTLSIESFKSSFVNLAIPFFSMAEPVPANFTTIKIKGEDWSWSQWDFIDVDIGNVTLKEFIDHIRDRFGLQITMLSYGSAMPYSEFGNRKKIAERVKMSMTQVIEDVTKERLEPNSNFMLFEACVMNDEMEDVEIPPIRFKYKS